MKIVKNRNRGFSLTELLIVITLIVIVLALALPAFNFITGSKSADAAQNQISAMLGRARNEAIGVQELRGVFFYLDPATDQYTVALVGQAKFGDPGASGTTYKAGDYVEKPGSSTPPVPPQYFVAMTDTTSAPSNSPPTWAQTDEYAIDLVPDVDQLKLPKGVGVQLLTDTTAGMTGSPPYFTDRYLRYGAILFDSAGRIVHQQYSVCFGGTLGTQMGLADQKNNPSRRNYTSDTAAGGVNPATGTGTGAVLKSSFGFVLYDREAFSSQAFLSNNTNDFRIRFPVGGTSPNAYKPDEEAEEAWLDQNAVPVLINRYNGTLLRGE